MISLKKPYLSIESDRLISYGGSQMFSDSETIRKCGCGPVAALDTVWYMEQSGTSSKTMSLSEYSHALSMLTKRYFPLFPPFGINGIAFVVGLNRLLREKDLPYRAVWMVSGNKLWSRVEEMLSRDLPVILSIGPNFPMFWQNNRLPFYQKLRDGNYRRVTAAKGHFVTATGIDAEWLRISSWGHEYYIRKSEYESYTRSHSNYAFSNMVYLNKTTSVKYD